MLTEDTVRRALNEAFPSLDAGSLRYFNAGWDYELWELDGELLACFPLRENCGERLPVEARLLRELAGSVSLATPTPIHESDGVAAFPQPFFVYQKLTGTAMGAVALNDTEHQEAAKQLGRFLSELHAFPVERAAAIGVPERIGARWRQRYVNLRPRVEHDIYPLLTSDETAFLTSFWGGFLAREDLVSFTPSLIHGDLALDHILVDATGSVTGVIDFGDARVGDPALDFAGFDAPLRTRVVAHYARPAGSTMLERAAIYRDMISPLNYILFGQEHDARSLIGEGLEQLRESLAEAG